MPMITFIQPDGSQRIVDAKVGRMLVQVEVAENILGIEALCGGACMCATCQVHVDPDQPVKLPPPRAMEKEMLAVAEGADLAPDTRLSCQIRVTEELDGLIVRVASKQG